MRRSLKLFRKMAYTMGINGMETETALNLYDSLDGSQQLYESSSLSDQPTPGVAQNSNKHPPHLPVPFVVRRNTDFARPPATPPRPSFKRAAKDVRIRSTCTTLVRRVTGHCRTCCTIRFIQ